MEKLQSIYFLSVRSTMSALVIQDPVAVHQDVIPVFGDMMKNDQVAFLVFRLISLPSTQAL